GERVREGLFLRLKEGCEVHIAREHIRGQGTPGDGPLLAVVVSIQTDFLLRAVLGKEGAPPLVVKGSNDPHVLKVVEGALEIMRVCAVSAQLEGGQALLESRVGGDLGQRARFFRLEGGGKSGPQLENRLRLRVLAGYAAKPLEAVKGHQGLREERRKLAG